MSLKSQIADLLEKGDTQARDLFGMKVLYENRNLSGIFLADPAGVTVELDGVYVEVQGRVRIRKKELKGTRLEPGKRMIIGGVDYRILTVDENPMDICTACTLSKL